MRGAACPPGRLPSGLRPSSQPPLLHNPDNDNHDYDVDVDDGGDVGLLLSLHLLHNPDQHCHDQNDNDHAHVDDGDLYI